MSKIQQVGDELFEKFQAILPGPNSRTGAAQPAKATRGKPHAGQTLGEKLDRFYAEARALREIHHLGFLSRAQVIRHLQGRMISAGYESDLVYRVVFSLLLSAFVGQTK